MDSLRSPYIPVRWDLGTLNRVERGQLQAILADREAEATRKDLLLWAQGTLEGPRAALGLEILENLSRGQDELSRRAGEVRDTYLGVTPWHQRLEYHSQDFLKKLTDPVVMGGMLSGACANRALQGLGMRWWGGPAGSSWFRKQAGQWASRSLGFGGEVVGFLGAEKGLRELSGQAQDWSGRSLWNDAQSLALQLFFLKTVQSLSLTGFYRAHGLTPEMGATLSLPGLSGFSQRALPFAASVGGLYVAANAEAWRQGSPMPNPETALVDAMVFAAQYGWTGRFSQALVQAPLAGPMQVPSDPRGDFGIGARELSWRSGLSFATPEAIPVNGEPHIKELFSQEVFSRTLKPIRHMSPDPSEVLTSLPAYRRTLGNLMGLDPHDPQMNRILGIILDTDVPLKGEYQRQILAASYRSAPSVTRFHTTEQLSKADILERGVHAVHRAFQLNSFHKVYGTAFDALTEIIVTELVARNQPVLLGEFFRLVALNPQMRHLEGFMRQHGLSRDFELPAPGQRIVLYPQHPRARAFNEMMFIGEEYRFLSEYLGTFYEGSAVPRRFHPKNNFVQLADGTRVPVTPDLAFAAIKKSHDQLRKTRNGLEIINLFETALKRAERSAIPWFYLDRLIKVMLTDNPRHWNTMQPRFLEVAFHEGADYPQFFHSMEHSMQYTGKYDEAVYYSDGSVFSGYVNDPRTAERLIVMLPEIRKLLDSGKSQRRRDRFFERANLLMSRSQFKIDRDVVLGLLESSPSTFAQEALEAIRSGKVDFKMVSREEMGRYLVEDHGQTGLFLPPRMRRDGVRARPLILILKDHPEAMDPWDLLKRSIDFPRWLIHEFAHFKYDYSESEGFFLMRDRSHQLRGEFRAFLEETFFAMQHGFTREWLLGDVNPYGWASGLRGLIEQNYWSAPHEMWVKPDEVQSILGG